MRELGLRSACTVCKPGRRAALPTAGAGEALLHAHSQWRDGHEWLGWSGCTSYTALNSLVGRL